MREGVIAATLTGFMILIFLGSWRSTLIITVSIPLAVLSSLTALSLLGQTINVMTLGGLALAVGILVDDATVTIENINRHMEHGEDILTAITKGANEIMPPATVALFCICIAFVPLLTLGGVAGYLFRPLAMAVVFAMIASYILTYTLVPTMAHFLLKNQHPHGAGGESAEPRRVGFFGRFQQGFEHYFERSGRATSDCWDWRFDIASSSPAASSCFSLLSLGLAPFLGQDFFPSINSGAIKIHVRAPTGTRIEETTRLTDQVEQKIRSIIPPDRVTSVVNNIGLPVSGINLSYANTGTIGVFDADMLISMSEGPTPTDTYVKTLREQLPKAFPGTTFSFLPADIVSQILNFGSPAPLDVQIAGTDLNANRAFAMKLLAKIRHVPGIADPRIQEAFQDPALKVDFNREFAGVVGLTENDASTSLQTTLSGSTQTAPTYWLSPNGVSYGVSVQTPQYGIDTLGDLKYVPLRTSRLRPSCLAGLATFSPEPLNAITSHYNIRPVVNIYATTQDRDLGGVAADVQKIVDDARGELPEGRDRRDTRASGDDAERLLPAVRRLGLLHRADLSPDRRQLPVLARPVRDHHRASGGLGGNRVDAVSDPNEPVGSRPDRRDHVHGRGDGEQHSCRQLRPRTDDGRKKRSRRCARGRRDAFQAGADDRARHDHRHGADGHRGRRKLAARTRRHRRSSVRDFRDAVVRADGVLDRAPIQSEQSQSQRAGAPRRATLSRLIRSFYVL